mgnify:FL=1
MKVRILESILSANDGVATANRRLLDSRAVYCINLMASPGAGKTTFILAMARHLGGRLRMGVIEADLASRVDADKVAAAGLPVLQINTDGGCHLNAPQVTAALETMPLDDIDLLIIENVGNLVCTVGYDLGEHLKLVLASVPEGDDKPYKYPNMFGVVQAVVVTKTDLKPYIPFSSTEFAKALRGINPDAPLFELSATTGEGLDRWCEWLVKRLG